jgi:Cdc6-like AAA superfamily ATPase
MTRKRQAINFATQTVKSVRVETVAEIESKLADRFEALAIMSEATGKGINRSLIVSGPAGLGKSFTVEAKLAELEQKGHSVTYIKGYVRPLALYKLLYETRHPNSVLVFDDSDSVFYDDVSMNLLKGACDSTERRVLHWLSKSIEKEEDEEGESIPEKFEFQGSIIFITNYDFDSMIESGNKLAPHFQALVSRSHYLDLAMKTKMDYIVRIRQVVRGGMLRDRGFNAAEQTMILEFIENNMERLRELSLRMVVKISGLYKMDKKNWQKLAKQTCFRNAA